MLARRWAVIVVREWVEGATFCEHALVLGGYRTLEAAELKAEALRRMPHPADETRLEVLVRAQVDAHAASWKVIRDLWALPRVGDDDAG